MDVPEYAQTRSDAANLLRQIRTARAVEVAAVEVEMRRAMGDDDVWLPIQGGKDIFPVLRVVGMVLEGRDAVSGSPWTAENRETSCGGFICAAFVPLLARGDLEGDG